MKSETIESSFQAYHRIPYNKPSESQMHVLYKSQLVFEKFHLFEKLIMAKVQCFYVYIYELTRCDLEGNPESCIVKVC